MQPDTFQCPECNASLQYSPTLQVGDKVQCPKCHGQFAVPASASSLPPAPSTEDYTDAPSAPRSRRSRPQDEEYSSTRTPAGYGPADEPDEDHPYQSSAGYSIDINRWFGFAGEHYSAVLGPMIGFILLAALITIIPLMIVSGAATFVGMQVAPNEPGVQMLVSQVITLLGQLVLMAFVVFPLGNGVTAVCLAQLKGRPWAFGDFFSGFQHFGPLAGVGLASQLLGLVVSLPQMAFTFIAIQNHDPQLLAVGPVLTLIGLVFVIYFQVRLFTFAPALIFDRNLGAMDSMKASWELTRGHFWGLLGVLFLLGLINVGGALACLIGLLFALPYTMLVQNAGYVLITRGRRRDEFASPYTD